MQNKTKADKLPASGFQIPEQKNNGIYYQFLNQKHFVLPLQLTGIVPVKLIRSLEEPSLNTTIQEVPRSTSKQVGILSYLGIKCIMHIKTIDFTISIHNWLQVLVLGDDIGYLTNCEISVFILLDNDNKRRHIKNPNRLLKNRLQN